MFVLAKLRIIKEPRQLPLYLYKVKKVKKFQGETNVIQSMKSSDSKHLAGYIFTCCLALVPSSPLLAVSAVQSLLAVSLYAVPVSKYRGDKFLEIRLCLAPSQDPTQKIG